MSLNSVNTNIGAMIALQSLNRTGAEMAATQKAISTGFSVSDAKDDGAAFAIAQRVRSDVSGLTAVNKQLTNTKGLLDTTLKGLSKVSDTMAKMKDTLVSLGSESVTGADRENYIAQYKQMLQSVNDFVKDATYSNKTLIANIGSGASTADKDAIGFGNVSVVRNESGNFITVAAVDLKADLDKLDFGAASANYSASNMQAVLNKTSTAATYGGVFNAVQTVIGKTQNTFGTSATYIDAQVAYNSDKIDAMKGGLGALVDADLSKEAANLQALQVRQQLGTQALSIANQAPQSLLSLFR